MDMSMMRRGRGRQYGLSGLTAALACMALAALPGSALAANSCPNEQVRVENHSTSLPDCRAYELVSPPYKEGHPVIPAVSSPSGASRISADGAHIIANNLGVFAGAEDDPPGEGSVSGGSYEFSRSQAGWVTTPLVPPASQFTEDSSFPTQLVSSDFGTTTWVLNTASEFPQQLDLYLRMPDGAFVRVGPMTAPGAQNNKDSQSVVGGSNDLSHVLFSLTEARWPGDTTSLELPGLPTGSIPSLYESIVGASSEEPKLVGVSNGGPLASNLQAQLIGNCGTELGGAQEGEEFASHAVSAGGGTVFFTTRACGGAPPVNELYARIEGSRTVAISEPSLSVPGRECTGVCREDENQENGHERQPAHFEGASEDGSKVFFITAQPLLGGDTDTTSDLYEAEVTSGGIQRLVQVSKGDASDATLGNGARVLGVAAISGDGTRVYFVAEGVLTTAKNRQELKAVAGAPNLYMVEPASGHTAFITTLLPSDEGDWLPGKSKTATPDGRFLVFHSAGQLFEYDSQTGALASVASSGFAPHVSNDGSYVFFMSNAALTPQAVNGSNHIYEYHTGQVSLISDGLDVQGGGATLTGTDASGENVFFTTVDPLVPQDTDTQVDIYDARIGGGFPAPVSAVGCSGDGCQGSSSIPPVLPLATTSTADAGNLAPPVSKPVVKPLTKAQRLARGLKACRTKHNKHQRAICEAQARKKYGPTHKAKKANRRVK